MGLAYGVGGLQAPFLWGAVLALLTVLLLMVLFGREGVIAAYVGRVVTTRTSRWQKAGFGNSASVKPANRQILP